MLADAGLIEADANKQNSTPKENWDHSAINAGSAPRVAREILDILDDAAFGAARDVEPKFTSHSDPSSQCPSKLKCCPNADARKITHEDHEDARQVARDVAKTRQCDISMKQRKKVEMLFAHLKRILGLGRLRLRGPSGAIDEFRLAATAQNLRKLAKIFPARPQLCKA